MLAHASALPVPTLPLEPIRLYVALQRDLEDYIAIAVRQALARGAEWDEISALTATSTSLLKSRFSQPQVSKVRSRRRKGRPTRPRPSAAASASWHAGEAPVYVVRSRSVTQCHAPPKEEGALGYLARDQTGLRTLQGAGQGLALAVSPGGGAGQTAGLAGPLLRSASHLPKGRATVLLVRVLQGDTEVRYVVHQWCGGRDLVGPAPPTAPGAALAPPPAAIVNTTPSAAAETTNAPS